MAPSSVQNAVVADEELVGDTLRILLHEMRQPLAAVFALADTALNRPRVPAEVRRCLSQIIEQAQEISEVAGSVLERRAAGGETAPVDVDEVVDSVVAGFGQTWSGTVVRRGDRSAVRVLGDRVGVRRCLVNVVDNAAHAAGPQGTVTVTVHHEAEVVRVLVEDDGPGFGHVPQRTGLGLPVSRRELEAIGGSLAVGLPCDTGGGCVALSLPVLTADPSSGAGRLSGPA
jgi:signal transduction histidine kinase